MIFDYIYRKRKLVKLCGPDISNREIPGLPGIPVCLVLWH